MDTQQKIKEFVAIAKPYATWRNPPKKLSFTIDHGHTAIR
jgi:hypothetical protein